MTSSHDSMCHYAAPVLAVCGYSGSGKTTLLEAAISRLVARGLAVAVVKHDAHGFEVDRPGKDSDRLFRAGATVALRGPAEQFERRAEPLSLQVTLARLACDHDLLLVEGHKQTPLPKFWLADSERSQPPEDVSGVVSTLDWNAQADVAPRLAAFLEYIDRWLPQAWEARPLHRGLLLGGKSTRMGQPKQNVPFGERTLGQIALEALSGAACYFSSNSQSEGAPHLPPLADVGRAEDRSAVVLLGSGPVPESPRAWLRLPDPPEFGGPAAGMIAGHRWAPEAAWVVAACDHPWLRAEHIEWLASQRQPGRWAIIPRQRDGHPCPTLALYEPQALEAIERRARADAVRRADPGSPAIPPLAFGGRGPSAVLDLPRALVVEPPAGLADGWTNVNTPEQLGAEEQRLRVEIQSPEIADRGQSHKAGDAGPGVPIRKPQ